MSIGRTLVLRNLILRLLSCAVGSVWGSAHVSPPTLHGTAHPCRAAMGGMSAAYCQDAIFICQDTTILRLMVETLAARATSLPFSFFSFADCLDDHLRFLAKSLAVSNLAGHLVPRVVAHDEYKIACVTKVATSFGSL